MDVITEIFVLIIKFRSLKEIGKTIHPPPEKNKDLLLLCVLFIYNIVDQNVNLPVVYPPSLRVAALPDGAGAGEAGPLYLTRDLLLDALAGGGKAHVYKTNSY